MLIELDEQRHELVRSFGIEVGCWLIGKDELGAGHDCPRDRDPLLLSPRHRRRAAIFESLQADFRQNRHRFFLPFGRGNALDLHDEFDILPRAQDRDQVVRLKNKSDLRQSQLRQLAFAQVVDAFAGYSDLATIGTIQPTDRVQ